MTRKECYYYFEDYDMGAHIPCCACHDGLGNCPCKNCKKYISKFDVRKIIKMYCNGELVKLDEDTISREKAINLLNKYFTRLYYDHAECLIEEFEALPSVQPKYNASEWCKDYSEYDHDKHCCPRYNGVIRKTVEEIKQPKIKTGHWIPVSKRLPQPNRKDEAGNDITYLVQTEWGTFFIATYDGNWCHVDSSILVDSEVIAWMLLPEPYKVESEE